MRTRIRVEAVVSAERLKCRFAHALVLAGLFGALGVESLAAQNLIGVVTDSAKRPLPEVDIILGPSGLRVRTDSAGRFTVHLRNGGRVEVKARLIGFRQFIDTVRVPSTGTERIAVRMERLPQRLSARVITDRRQCAEFALSGFECRRDSGIGYFRDAGELRAMQPQNWADMLDGLPGLRRRMKRDGPGWDVGPVPSRCLRAIYNGNMPMWLQDEERKADAFWEPNDVVAIEYYPEYRDVPPQYQRYAWWPRLLGQPCGLIVYWLRGADATERVRPAAVPDPASLSHEDVIAYRDSHPPRRSTGERRAKADRNLFAPEAGTGGQRSGNEERRGVIQTPASSCRRVCDGPRPPGGV